MNRYWKTALPAMVVAILTGAAAAQPSVETLMSGMAANAKQLRQYTYKQRTETYRQGDLKNAKVDEVHYNPSGERVSIPLDEQKIEAESPRRGPGHRLIVKKIEEEKSKMKEYIERLMSLSSRYLASDPARLQAAMTGAEVTTGGGNSHVRIRIRDYVKSGDSMTMSFDPSTKRPIQTEVNTMLDDTPVTIVLGFDQIHDGPNYPGKTVVKADAKQLEVRVFTYDYRL